jgi:ferredoxin-NADP reductase
MSPAGVVLAACEPVAASTVAFRFKRPSGFTFKAGQAVDLVLPDAAERSNGDARHAFSIASAPSEDELLLAMRMRDTPFKAALARMTPGATALLEGPFGSLTLHRAAARDALFIAGGIGITPFLSILRDAAERRDARRFTLIYSNRRPEDAAFLDELLRLERDYDRFRLVATMTDLSASAREWNGPTRPVDAYMIREAIERLSSPVAYVVGPPGMVTAMRGVLAAAGVDDDDVRSEEFFGY